MSKESGTSAGKIYRAIIIGGGVGGLMTGRYLENSLVLERSESMDKSFARSGEGISSLALERFKIKPDAKWVSSAINTIKRISPSKEAYGSIKNNLGYVIDLRGFKKFLVSECLAEIKMNTEIVDLAFKNKIWEVKTNNGEVYKSKYLIGADGVNSIVRRKVFKEKVDIIPAIQYLVELEGEIDTMVAKIYLDKTKFPEGYAWIFPKSKKSANIGIVGRADLSSKLKDFLEETVRPKYNNFKILENKSGVISFGGAKLKLFKNNAMLIGDAAGLADPIFLGGLNQAMWSGKIAAECILEGKGYLYEKKIKASPFADPMLLEARKMFYSFDNETINDITGVLGDKGSVYLKTFFGVYDFILRPSLRRNFLKVFKFFSTWSKVRDFLW